MPKRKLTQISPSSNRSSNPGYSEYKTGELPSGPWPLIKYCRIAQYIQDEPKVTVHLYYFRPTALLRVFANKIEQQMHVYNHVGAISNIYCNLSKYKKCICVNVQGVFKYIRRLR
jgi:hypothetical protein